MASFEAARGYKSTVKVIFESAYRTRPDNPEAVLVPVLDCDLDGGRSLVADKSILGQFAPSKPSQGNMTAGGSIRMTAGLHMSGIIMKMLCGLPVTTEITAAPTLSGSPVKVGPGLVKLPCAGHGFRHYTQVTVRGTTNYDGVYIVQPESGADDIVIEAIHVDEAFAGTETVKRGAYRKLKAAAAVDKGDGLVGLPCEAHGYNYGENITVTGTTGYDGNYVVHASSTADEIVIESVFADENFGGAEEVASRFFRHLFKTSDRLPSFTVEEEIPVDAAENNAPFWLSEGCKISSFSYSSSGSTEGALDFSLNATAAICRNALETAAGSVKKFAHVNFTHSDGELQLGGEKMASAISSGINVGFSLDTTNGYTKGSKGTLTCLNEDDITIGASLSCHYTDTKLGEKAADGVVMDFVDSFISKGSQISFILPESQIEPKGTKPKIKGPSGITIEAQVQGFQENNAYEAPFVAELINGIASYA
ncbi:phage tail tube protein [Maridesulfovibrio sp.]|uniref:phage tail tube protein n=1 Tax=Maridesulfovibrio sp. TaxID=2795000 RepID=UPI0029C9FA6A|nr:phage tail tube protein [Maridesulfovibrio sp.]